MHEIIKMLQTLHRGKKLENVLTTKMTDFTLVVIIKLSSRYSMTKRVNANKEIACTISAKKQSK